MARSNPLLDLPAGGECGRLVRAADWGSSALGPPESWPTSLWTALGMVLESGYPMAVAWGPDQCLFYNDAYRPLLGSTKHPGAMGRPARQTFPEIWDQIAPLFERVLSGDGPVTLDDQLFVLDRNGYPEECYFDFSYGAIRDGTGRVAGVLVACAETTRRVVAARRLSTLRDLAGRTAWSTTLEAVAAAVAEVLGQNTADVPFSALYALDPIDGPARLLGTSGLPSGAATERLLPGAAFGTPWPIGAWGDGEHVRELDELAGLMLGLPDAARPQSPARALVLAVREEPADPPRVVLVAGVSPRLRLDEEYRSFYRSIAAEVGAAVRAAGLLERELASRERLRYALAAGGMGTWEWDFRGNRLTWSPELEELHGLAPGSFGGTFDHYFADVHPDDVDHVREAIRKGAERGELRVEYRIVGPNGTVRWREARGRVHHDREGRAVGMLGLCLDATARNEASEARTRLYQTERRAREAAERVQRHLAVRDAVGTVLAEAALDEAPPRILGEICRGLGWEWGAFWEVNSSGRALECVATWSDPVLDAAAFEAATRAQTFARGEGIPGRIWATARPVWVRDVRRSARFLRAAVASRADLRGFLGLPIRSGGHVVAVVELLAREPRRREADVVSTLVGIGDKVGQFVERRRAEEEVARLYQAERAARAEAEAAVRGRDEFVATVSHDLGNPLAAIKGHVQLLRRRLARGEPPPAEQLEHRLSTIEGSAADMDRLIGDLLDAARLQAGRPLELRLQPADLVEIARASLAPYAQASDGHRFRLDADAEPAVGSWDVARIRRVLSNLFSNAVKYSPDGSDVLVRVWRESGHAALSVRDQGLGIPAADLPHVFERYHRGANVAQRVAGTGIGLAGAREIVEQHGGTIAIESAEGRGTTVTLRLPLTPAGPLS